MKPMFPAILFGIAGVLFLAAALLPMLGEGDMNVVFFCVGLVWLMLALIMALKIRSVSRQALSAPREKD